VIVVVLLLLLLLLPLPFSAHAEDPGELSANPVGLSGSFSFLVCLVHLVSLVFRSANPLNGKNKEVESTLVQNNFLIIGSWTASDQNTLS
jgi:hypothetical protein